MLLRLKSLPDVTEVTRVQTDSIFTAAYELRVRQPLDHTSPSGKTFLQSVFIAHIDTTRASYLKPKGTREEAVEELAS